MRVTPRSRRSRGPFIWLMLMIIGGLTCFLSGRLGSDALRGFDQDVGGNVTPVSGLTGRINVLLLGIDQREGMTGPARTDTMIVLTLDPQAKTAGMFSINRDLWVTLPDGQGDGKINTAHFLGEALHLPGGGPALAQKTVESVFNIPVPYYVRFNFAGFEKLIDLIGGIDVYVDQPIDDPDYPDVGFGYEPFHIDAGWQHLDGLTALKYARTRATAGSDFDRVKRQQQVIMTVRDKILKQNLLPQLLPQAGVLMQTLGDSVQTNLTPRQIYQLANFAGQLDRNKITSVTLDSSLIEPLFIDQQSALLLKPGAAQLLRDRLYGLTGTPVPANQSLATAPTALPVTLTPAPSSSATPLQAGTPIPTDVSTPNGTPATPSTYIVQAGDTLFSLARRYNVTVDELLSTNGLTSDSIYVGQQLIIPSHYAQ